jgi:hypothetical protein
METQCSKTHGEGDTFSEETERTAATFSTAESHEGVALRFAERGIGRCFPYLGCTMGGWRQRISTAVRSNQPLLDRAIDFRNEGFEGLVRDILRATIDAKTYDRLIADKKPILRALIVLVCEEIEGGRDFSLTFFPRAKWRRFINCTLEDSRVKGWISNWETVFESERIDIVVDILDLVRKNIRNGQVIAQVTKETEPLYALIRQEILKEQ